MNNNALLALKLLDVKAFSRRGKQCVWRGLNNKMEMSSGVRTWCTLGEKYISMFANKSTSQEAELYILWYQVKKDPRWSMPCTMLRWCQKEGADDGSKQARSSHLKWAPLVPTKTAPPLDIDETAEANIGYMHNIVWLWKDLNYNIMGQR